MKNKLLKWLGINNQPIVKIYKGYGHAHQLVIFGHVLARSPLPQTHSRNNILRNILQLMRLFWIKPMSGICVELQWEDKLVTGQSSKDGFFKLEWSAGENVPAGNHIVNIRCLDENKKTIAEGMGTFVVPHITQLGVISDVDDTFLISHSATIFKRLYTLFTLNAAKRKIFEGVGQHYRQLQYANTIDGEPNPFFYISSSEWNLYDYLQNIIMGQELPDGVFLLSALKQWFQLLKTGKTNHGGKFSRAVRILKTFPNQQFILLGDNSQKDPEIYQALAAHHPGRILAVYIRIVNSNLQAATALEKQLRKAGIPCCLFRHSKEAMEHSASIGLA